MMMRSIYTLLIRLYYGLIYLATPFNTKARQWIHGRKNLIDKINRHWDETDSVIWFHAASLGEFEQGRPLMEAMRKEFPEKKILLTFFSPSGYEVRKDTPLADLVCYLPIDTPHKVKAFIQAAHPESLFIIKYEFWYNLLKEIHQQNIPVCLVSGIFRPQQHFFRWYGSWFLHHLKRFKWFFVQDQKSVDLLNKAGIHQVSISGDTRFDRVATIAAHEPLSGFPTDFFDGSPVFMAGSTWPADEKILQEAVDKFPNIKWIFAPHHVSREYILPLRDKFRDQADLLSEITHSTSKNIIIVDSFGLLNKLYRYATLVYIGGGFGHGIHNILEAAVYGCPVIFGPKHRIFREAIDLLELGGAFTIKNSQELIQTLDRLLHHHDIRQKASEICSQYVMNNQGATDHITQMISHHSIVQRGSQP